MDEGTQTALGCVWGLICIVFLVVVIFTGGTFRTAVTFEVPRVVEGAEEVPFEETFSARHWLGGVIRGEQVDLEAWLDGAVRDGEQVARLTVETKHTVTDLLLMGVTLGIYAPETVVVRGTIYRGEIAASR